MTSNTVLPRPVASPRLPIELLRLIVDEACRYQDLRLVAPYSVLDLATLAESEAGKAERRKARLTRWSVCLIKLVSAFEVLWLS
jgi:hypothetical protein